MASTLQRHLDGLTFCGSAINDLELRLSNARAAYRRTYEECKVRLEETRRRLGASIPKSQPFIEVWRRARQVQDSFLNYVVAVFVWYVRYRKSPTKQLPDLTRQAVSIQLQKR